MVKMMNSRRMTITDGNMVNISKMAIKPFALNTMVMVMMMLMRRMMTLTIKLFALNTMVMVMMMLKTRMMTMTIKPFALNILTLLLTCNNSLLRISGDLEYQK